MLDRDLRERVADLERRTIPLLQRPRRNPFAVHREQVTVGDLMPAGVPIETFGGDYDRIWEGFAVLDKVKGIARLLCGIAGEDHRFAVRYPDVEGGRYAETGADI